MDQIRKIGCVKEAENKIVSCIRAKARFQGVSETSINEIINVARDSIRENIVIINCQSF